ncbi:MAG: hypothetical protein IKC60_03810 [Clostridia bacterium]|nr:hypothetical protein [Clostridia bacterium]
MDYEEIKRLESKTYENDNVEKRKIKKKGGWAYNAIILQLAVLMVLAIAFTIINFLGVEEEVFAPVKDAFSIDYEG